MKWNKKTQKIKQTYENLSDNLKIVCPQFVSSNFEKLVNYKTCQVSRNKQLTISIPILIKIIIVFIII